jgi:hypothetical protein
MNLFSLLSAGAYLQLKRDNVPEDWGKLVRNLVSVAWSRGHLFVEAEKYEKIKNMFK